MKETVLDVLMYMFEHYMDDEPEPDRDSLYEALSEAGFDHDQVDDAFGWLDELNQLRSDGSGSQVGTGLRVFSELECLQLDVTCRGFLMHLEQSGILTAAQREVVVDRLMALGSDEVDVEHVKWVVLMVLFNQPGQEEAYARMEGLVFEDASAPAH